MVTADAARSASLLVVVALVAAFAVPSCRCGDSGDTSGPDASSSAPSSPRNASSAAPEDGSAFADDAVVDADAGAGETFTGEAGSRFRDAAPGIAFDTEAPPDPACIGDALVLAVVVVDPRCASDLERAKKLRYALEHGDGGTALRQEAKAVEHGLVQLRLVNGGAAPVVLPLSFHGKLPAFSVLAEDDHHTIYELEPPLLPLADPGQGARAHVARIVLAAGGSAVATIAIRPGIAKVLGRGASDPCKRPDASASVACNVTQLGKGRYVLYIGELLTDVDAGPPARLGWELP